MFFLSAHSALQSNFHSSLENSANVTAESAVWRTFMPWVGRNSSVALQFPSNIPHVLQQTFPKKFVTTVVYS